MNQFCFIKEKFQWYDDAARRIPNFFVIQDEIANFIDGRNSILDIRNSVSVEFGPVVLEDVFNFVDGIREAGFVTFLNRSRMKIQKIGIGAGRETAYPDFFRRLSMIRRYRFSSRA